jgi:hypothetical protein
MSEWRWALLPVCMLLGAITFRIRGGLFEGKWYGRRGQLMRLTWAAACSLTVLAAGGAWDMALAVLPLAWLATTLPLWDTIDMGRNQGTFNRDLAVGTIHGLLMAGCVTGALCAAAWWERRPDPLWWLVLLGGAAWGLCYALAYVLTLPTHRLRLGHGAQEPETGELFFGLVFSAALFVAVI